MSEERTYNLTYAEAEVRDAVKTYVWRRGVATQKLLWAAEVLVVGLLIWLGQTDTPQWHLAVLGVVAALPPCLMSVMWAAHYQHTVGKFRRLEGGRAQLTIRDGEFDVASNLGAVRIPWQSISEVWERGGYWMFFLRANEFFTIPVTGITETDLDLIRSRIPRAAT